MIGIVTLDDMPCVSLQNGAHNLRHISQQRLQLICIKVFYVIRCIHDFQQYVDAPLMQ